MYWFVYLVALCGALFIFWIVLAHRKQNAAKAAFDVPLAAVRSQRAAALGWGYTSVDEGDIRYRFSGTTQTGYPWELCYDSDASSSVSQPKLVFAITALRSERTEFEISAGRSFEQMRSATGMKATSVVASIARAVGSSAAQDAIAFHQEAAIQQEASSRLKHRFKVIGRHADDAAALLTGEVQQLLLNWPPTAQTAFDPYQKTLISQGPKGLVITCDYDGTDMPLVEHIVAIGGALASVLRELHPELQSDAPAANEFKSQ